jgi:hypothetical protein
MGADPLAELRFLHGSLDLAADRAVILAATILAPKAENLTAVRPDSTRKEWEGPDASY